MKRMRFIPAVVGLVMALIVGVQPAWAYFTDTHWADGGLKITIPTVTTDIQEWFGAGKKHVKIENKKESEAPVHIRARVYAPAELNVTASGTKWSGPDADGWYDFADPVAPGAKTEELTVAIDLGKLPVKSDSEAEGYVNGDNFNVIVIYEATPLLNAEGGN